MFDPQNTKKPPQSRHSVVSEFFSFTAQQPKWQNSCFQMWPIEQLYIELGLWSGDQMQEQIVDRILLGGKKWTVFEIFVSFVKINSIQNYSLFFFSILLPSDFWKLYNS